MNDTTSRLARFLPTTLMLCALILHGGCLPFWAKKPVEQAKPAAPPATAAPCVTLALPVSGSYAPVSAKIRRGAQTAQQEMAKNGITLHLRTVNTESPNWLADLAALPMECAVVGGPLQTNHYAQARQSGAVGQRTFFTFLPALEHGDEGTRAWRFFPSPQDQIDALLAFAADTLDIRAFGVFYPADAYGAAMTGLFEQSLAARNMLAQKASYTPGDASSWSEAVALLIRPTTREGSKTPIPQTSFEALFLPDSWKSMDMLTTSLLYNGEDRLVLLGTTLWEQGLSGKMTPNAEKYALAIFPGAWNALQTSQVMQGNDFWVALGYDFTRFAANMGINSRLTALEISARAARIAQMAWSMAPISWDLSGLAHQKLFLFQVSPTGMTPLNPEQFQLTRAAVLQRAALRMQGLPSLDAEGNPLVPGAPADATNQPALPLSATPQPSYKLRLPGAPGR
ncbi:MAG: hypothetical protein LBB60_02345 [Desulfovibrio sp.]|jgi:hypothetical protein|nr:hypothetical protein [Desulfovibrio sp.]